MRVVRAGSPAKSNKRDPPIGRKKGGRLKFEFLSLSPPAFGIRFHFCGVPFPFGGANAPGADDVWLLLRERLGSLPNARLRTAYRRDLNVSAERGGMKKHTKGDYQ